MTDKPALRAKIRARRDAFVASSPPPIAPPAELCARFASRPVVASYHPVGSEADPTLLVQAALAAGCRIALPHVTRRDHPMHFLAWDAAAPLVSGPFGLSQPHHAAADLAPDLILTPLLAFDAALNRLGQGAGYYDRAFARYPAAARIGVAWSVQRADLVPAEPWDVPLHAVITEQGWQV